MGTHLFLKSFRYLRDKTASIMPMTAIMLPLIVGMTGLGVDAGMWMMNKRNLQTAADAASMAAAWEIANNNDDEDYAEFAALKEAQNNGYNPEANGELDIEIGEDEEGRTEVTATISQETNVYFSSIIFSGDVYTSAAAASVIVDEPGDFCFLGLDDSADSAFSAVGNVEVDAGGCGIAINSNSDSALDLMGSVVMNVGTIDIVGDAEIGSSVDLEYTNMNTNASHVPDPYRDLETPDFTGCTEAEVRRGPTRVSRDTTLNPGVYCGGISISGNEDVVFNPGVYILDGGGLTVTGGGSITGDGVSFVLTNSGNGSYGQVDISGGKTIALNAPEEGEEMEGVVFYQDRDAPESVQCNSMTGSSSIEINGAIYFPSQCLAFGGNHEASSESEDPCTRVIAKTISLHGNPSIGNNCEGNAAKDITRITIRLVM